MGLVAASLVLVLATGCYAPELRDCTVTCSAATDCIGEQTCANGWCATIGAACTATGPMADASVATPDTASAVDAALDAAVRPDSLRVTVLNEGSVVVDGVGTCTSPMMGGMAMVCDYTAVHGVQLVAHATPIDEGHEFAKWTDPVCKLQQATCAFTPLAAISITAQFK